MGKAEKTLDQHIETLTGGGLFWRKLPHGKEPKTVWLALKLDDAPCTNAVIEWRQYQSPPHAPMRPSPNPIFPNPSVSSTLSTSSFPQGILSLF